MNDIARRIQSDVKSSFHHIRQEYPEHHAEWLQNHLVEPRAISLVIDLDTGETAEFWLVTDHVGEKDANLRIVFDPRQNLYGTEFTVDDGTEWYQGSNGSFLETFDSL